MYLLHPFLLQLFLKSSYKNCPILDKLIIQTMKNLMELLKEYEELTKKKKVINDDFDEFIKELEDKETKEILFNHHHKDELKLFLNDKLSFYFTFEDEDYIKEDEKIVSYLESIEEELKRIGLIEDDDYSVYYNELYEHNIVGEDIFQHLIHIRNTTILHRIIKLNRIQRRLKGF